MLIKGFRFGLLLQLAIGPVCAFIFDMGNKKGMMSAEAGVLAVTLVDGFFILLAILGITAFLQKEAVRRVLKVIGVIILVYFGITTIIDAVQFQQVTVPEGAVTENPFIKGLLLTVSNPLTILFWAGVFSSKVAEEQFTKEDMTRFGLGAVLSTLIFLSLVGMLGTIASTFLPSTAIHLLNIAVGISFLYFAVRLAVRKA